MSSFDLMHTTDVVRSAITTLLGSEQYREDHLDQWSQQIIDACQRSLATSYPSFK